MRPLYEVLSYLKPYRLRVAITVAATVRVTATSLASPGLVR